MKRLRPWGALLLLLCALLLGWAWWPRSQPGRAPEAPEPATRPRLSLPLRAAVGGPVEALQDADPRGGLLLEGQVLGVDGAPAVGAVVWLDTVPPRQASADAYGWFSFEGLSGRPYQIAARRGDASAGPFSFSLTADAAPITLRLVRGSTLEIEVRDAEDHSLLSGAQVSLSAVGIAQAQTGPDGVARFPGVNSGRLWVRAVAPGYGPSRRELFPLGTPGVVQRYTLSLAPGAEVSGYVQSESGAPIAGARVEALPGAGLSFHASALDVTSTDEAGRFVFQALSAGAVRLRASHADFAPGSSPPLDLDGITPVRDLRLTLPAGDQLSGQVVDLEGAPVPFAVVRFVFHQESSLRESRQLYCDERGSFVARGLPRTEIALTASNEAATSARYFVDLRAEAPREPLTLVLEDDGHIGGVVVDAQGAPVPDVVVRVLARRAVLTLPTPAPSVLTDADGRFLLRGLAPGEHTIQAVAPGASRQSLADFTLENGPALQTFPTGTEDARLTLLPGGTVRGRVRQADGRVPARFSVQVDGNPFEAIPFVETGGAFTVTELAPATHYLVLVGDTFEETTLPDFSVAPGEDKDLGEIVLPVGASVSGEVVDAEGRAVSGARVIVAERLGDGLGQLFGFSLDYEGGKETRSDARGRFVIQGLREREYWAVAEHPRAGRSSAVRAAPGTPLRLALAPVGRIEGTITRGDEPIQAMLSLAPEGGEEERLTTSEADGRFRFDRVSAGRYRLRYGDSYRLSLVVVVTDDELREESLEVPAGEVVRVALSFPRRPTVLARALVGGEGVPAVLTLLPAAGEAPGSVEALRALSGQEGVRESVSGSLFAPKSELPPHTVVFASVAPGTYWLCGSTAEGRLGCEGLTVGEGSDLLRAEVRLRE